MTNIPQALVNALDASLPTLVEEGRLCFKSRRTHANGGSNSILLLPPLLPLLLFVLVLLFVFELDDDIFEGLVLFSSELCFLNFEVVCFLFYMNTSTYLPYIENYC